MELFKLLAEAAFWIILGMVVGVILAYIIKSMIKKRCGNMSSKN